jgi:hypothetical protein
MIPFFMRVLVAISVAVPAFVNSERVWGSTIPPANVRCLLLGAESQFNLGQVRDKLFATGVLNQVDILDLRTGLPTLQTLTSYDAITIHSNFSLPDPVALGNLLADYVDTGGGVVMMPFATRTDPSLAIAGRWKTQGYSPLPNGGGEFTGTWTISTIDKPGHPVLEGVGDVRFGSRFTAAGALATNAERIVAWRRGDNDPEAPLVAELPGFQGRVMLFNAYPEVSDLNDPGFRLLANTLYYAAVPEPCTFVLITALVLPAVARRRRLQ